MNNFIQPGNVLELTAPSGGVTSGTPVQIGQLVVIPAVTAAEGVRFSGQLVGVFTLAKATGQAWDEGEILYFDAGNDRFTTVATGNLQAGCAAAAAESADTTGSVRLDGIARVQEST
jgi:predicted RecA/RadA family phage recombinase